MKQLVSFPNRRPSKQPKAAEKSSRSFAARWGSKLLFDDGFLAVPAAFMDHYSAMDLNAGEAMFFLQLMSFKWTEAAPFPCYKTLSKRMGVTVEMVRTHAKNLENKGLLMREFRKGHSNAFDTTPLTAVLLNKVLQARKAKEELSKKNPAAA